MSIEVLQDNLCVNRLIEGKKKEITLESSIIVPDIKPDIVKPIDLSDSQRIGRVHRIAGSGHMGHFMQRTARVDGRTPVSVSPRSSPIRRHEREEQ